MLAKYKTELKLLQPHYLFIYFGVMGLNLGLCTCKAGTLLLEPHLQSHFVLVILEMGLKNYLPKYEP
jgi:hypothetical protein